MIFVKAIKAVLVAVSAEPTNATFINGIGY